MSPKLPPEKEGVGTLVDDIIGDFDAVFDEYFGRTLYAYNYTPSNEQTDYGYGDPEETPDSPIAFVGQIDVGTGDATDAPGGGGEIEQNVATIYATAKPQLFTDGTENRPIPTQIEDPLSEQRYRVRRVTKHPNGATTAKADMMPDGAFEGNYAGSGSGSGGSN